MTFRLLSLFLVAMLLAGCHSFSGTRMEAVSGQQATPATLSKVLLVGLTTTPQIQAEMEQAFAREFVDLHCSCFGVDGVAAGRLPQDGHAL